MLLFDFAITGHVLLWSIAAMFFGLLLLIQTMKIVGRKRSESDLNSEWKANGRPSVLDARNKYPTVDFFKYRNTFIHLGLVISIGLTFLLFSWTQYENITPIVGITDTDWDKDLLKLPPPTIDFPPPPPPVQKLEAVADDIIVKDPPKFKSPIIDDNLNVDLNKPQLKKIPNKHPRKKIKKNKITPPFIFVEQMPRFPGCEDLGLADAELKKCAQQKMLEFIYTNIKYPAIARENGIDGQVVIRFVVEADGAISNIEIVKDIGGKCGDEAKRVVELINKKDLKWIPGRQRGKKVRVQFVLPIIFKLN